jgi:hypothetical protein
MLTRTYSRTTKIQLVIYAMFAAPEEGVMIHCEFALESGLGCDGNVDEAYRDGESDSKSLAS